MFDEAFGEITEAKRSVRTMYKRAKKSLEPGKTAYASGVNAVNLKKW